MAYYETSDDNGYYGSSAVHLYGYYNAIKSVDDVETSALSASGQSNREAYQRKAIVLGMIGFLIMIICIIILVLVFRKRKMNNYSRLVEDV